jgi:hypothetical protein
MRSNSAGSQEVPQIDKNRAQSQAASYWLKATAELTTIRISSSLD